MFLSSFESNLCIVIYYWNQRHKNHTKLRICEWLCTASLLASALLCPRSVEAIEKTRETEKFEKSDFAFFLVSFSKLGPVHTGRPPPGIGVVASMSLGTRSRITSS